LTAEISTPNKRKRKLKARADFCLIGGLTLTSKIIMRMRDESSKERLITKERRPLTVLRKISSGTGLISRVGSDGNLGILKGSFGTDMIDYAMEGSGDCWLEETASIPQREDPDMRLGGRRASPFRYIP
jgi:hypothetical protein